MLSCKRCCTCKKNRSIDNFCKNRLIKDGYGRRCRECRRQARIKYLKKIKGLPEYDVYLAYVRNLRKKFKQKCIDYKGGKCSICGYNKCIAALEFHHVNPAEKDFKIGKKSLISMNKAKKELDKCILICVNCHRELHFLEKNPLG